MRHATAILWRTPIAKSVVGALRVTLGLDSAQFESGIKRSQKSVQTVSRSMGIVAKDVQGVERQIRQSATNINQSMKGLAASLATYFTGQELMKLADGFTRVQNSLKVAGLEGKNLAAVQSQLLDLSSRYGVGLESLASLFGNATQAGQELGAGQQQIVQLTEATSQALLITGTNATQASGAILGLTQALAAGTVRAEEFNQINEGGLRPLLQAAANSEKFGGSVAKLRAAVLDGKVSSQEFFAAILAGASGLEGQASRATLTLSGALEALNSRLMVYFGEADKANGVSAAFASALSKLGDNLDTIIPALAVVGTAIGARYVASVGLATAATVSKVAADVRATQSAAALAAAQARLGPLFTTSSVAANAASASVTRLSVAMGVAGRGATALMASLGPMALTITAIAMGFEVFSAVSSEGEDRLLANADAATELGVALDASSTQAANAAREQKGLGSAAAGAEPEMWGFKKSVDGLTESLWEQAKAARAARLELAKQRLAETRQRQNDALNATPDGRRLLGQEMSDAFKRGDVVRGVGKLWGGMVSGASNFFSGGRTGREGHRDFQDASRIAGVLESEIDRMENTPIGRGDLPEATAGGGGGISKPDKAAERAAEAARKRAQREAERAAEALRRFTDDLARENADLISTTAELTGTIEAQRDADINQIETERMIRERAVRADEDIDAAKKQQLVELNNQNAESRKQLARQQADEAIRDRTIRAEQMRNDLAIELMQLSADAARTARERRAVELRILEAQFNEEESRLRLEALSTDLEKATAARLRLEQLPAMREAATARAERSTQGPLEAYLDRLPKSAEDAREALERVQVDGIDGIVNGLADAATGARSLGDVFKQVTNQIIADLIRIQLQKAIVGGLSNVFGGILGGGGSATGGAGPVINTGAISRAMSGLPKFNTGGSFRVGGAPGIDKNVIAFKASRGEMVDIRRPGQDQGGGGVAHIVPSPYFDVIVDERSAAVAAPMAVAGSVQARSAAGQDMARASRRRIPGR
ncbi:tape measure protein [Sphingobium sp. JS3065]|uniref:tape measure protein n=1 Tax=Sphingobium sp. JS3065 TaxID=2970925 RepID=UPI0022654200|nr:tape measure protein [Sphingobium sp. JS3065]UZW54971.1 tape measure protein [Sphingobium sp. JS3065]